jgi:hypothetical protein
VEKPILKNGRAWETKRFPSSIRKMGFDYPRKIGLFKAFWSQEHIYFSSANLKKA